MQRGNAQVLDTCAAPGSKTAQILEMLHAGTAMPTGGPGPPVPPPPLCRRGRAEAKAVPPPCVCAHVCACMCLHRGATNLWRLTLPLPSIPFSLSCMRTCVRACVCLHTPHAPHPRGCALSIHLPACCKGRGRGWDREIGSLVAGRGYVRSPPTARCPSAPHHFPPSTERFVRFQQAFGYTRCGTWQQVKTRADMFQTGLNRKLG